MSLDSETKSQDTGNKPIEWIQNDKENEYTNSNNSKIVDLNSKIVDLNNSKIVNDKDNIFFIDVKQYDTDYKSAKLFTNFQYKSTISQKPMAIGIVAIGDTRQDLIKLALKYLHSEEGYRVILMAYGSETAKQNFISKYGNNESNKLDFNSISTLDYIDYPGMVAPLPKKSKYRNIFVYFNKTVEYYNNYVIDKKYQVYLSLPVFMISYFNFDNVIKINKNRFETVRLNNGSSMKIPNREKAYELMEKKK